MQSPRQDSFCTREGRRNQTENLRPIENEKGICSELIIKKKTKESLLGQE